MVVSHCTVQSTTSSRSPYFAERWIVCGRVQDADTSPVEGQTRKVVDSRRKSPHVVKYSTSTQSPRSQLKSDVECRPSSSNRNLFFRSKVDVEFFSGVSLSKWTCRGWVVSVLFDRWRKCVHSWPQGLPLCFWTEFHLILPHLSVTRVTYLSYTVAGHASL